MLPQDDLGLAGAVMENIKRAGYEKPTPVQKHALPLVCAGYDLMACAQTGSGKTAAFILPMISFILQKSCPLGGNGRSSFPMGLILAPTRELVQQIYDEGRRFCYRTGMPPPLSHVVHFYLFVAHDDSPSHANLKD